MRSDGNTNVSTKAERGTSCLLRVFVWKKNWFLPLALLTPGQPVQHLLREVLRWAQEPALATRKIHDGRSFSASRPAPDSEIHGSGDRRIHLLQCARIALPGAVRASRIERL